MTKHKNVIYTCITLLRDLLLHSLRLSDTRGTFHMRTALEQHITKLLHHAQVESGGSNGLTAALPMIVVGPAAAQQNVRSRSRGGCNPST